ncbi:hypothetical protein H6G82_23325 [Planktothricoides sp. FACHB-1261]|uniref:hypothetical protein n=2 Tax=Planktothricoides TaxID=132607 RepID=UPI0012E0FCA9|nr:hypothetical protein [Planktothricoides sp. SR001]MBD2585103.1 hypothetical protein [Planktothricoides raciborskii FACHB-1261]
MAIRPCTGEWPFAPTECAGLYNILSNKLSAGMLRPYKNLWFIRGENCCKSSKDDCNYLKLFASVHFNGLEL